jgi:hypothetical protein
MSTSLYVAPQPSTSEAASGVLADDLVEASHAKPADHITIAGGNRIDLVIELLHRGFLTVGCRAASGPHSGEPTDVLLIPDAADGPRLLAALNRLGSELRPGAVVAVHCRGTIEEIAASGFDALLEDRGFTVERIAFVNGSATFAARKRADRMRRAA